MREAGHNPYAYNYDKSHEIQEIIKLGEILNDVKSVTAKSDELNKIISEVQKSSRSISNLTEKLDQSKGTLGKLINDDVLHENMNNLVNYAKNMYKNQNKRWLPEAPIFL